MGNISDIRDILRGALASLGGFGGRMIARLILMIVAGKLYGPSPLGLLGQIAAITEILAAIAVLGLKRSLPEMLSAIQGEARQAVVIKEALIACLAIATLLTAILGVVWPFLFTDISMPTALYFAIPAIAFSDTAGAAIRFKRIIRWEILARCVIEPWVFLGAAVILYLLKVPETGLIVAFSLSCLGAAAGISIGLGNAFGWRGILAAPVRLTSVLRIPRKSLPVGVTDIGIMMFRRLDILVLSIVAGHGTTGIYYMAQQIVTIPHKIYQLFEPMMVPVLAKLHHSLRTDIIGSKLAGFCRWTFMLQLAITIPFAIFGGQLLGLFGDEFASGAIVLAFLLLAELFDGSFALTETALLYAKPGIPPRLVIVSLVTEVTFIALLAQVWGAAGAASGFMLSMAGLALMRLFMLRRHLAISILDTGFLPPLIFAGILAGPLMMISRLSEAENLYVFGPAILFFIGAYLVMVRFLALTTADKKLLKRLRAG
ncbi:lipopolysaccharide biosynthesis protein [Kordiimonas aestuarii]|uniref:lipopolysaccharide biosynthesis protein n=1 Tax=Kordiimonas aestuarii TaxID=1005925 RepID=UPI0021CFEB24|nr:lipopolysaccharide biosynthesis protein [Kordiimonas aestuarii]